MPQHLPLENDPKAITEINAFPTEPSEVIAVCMYEQADSSRQEEFKLLVQSAGYDKVGVFVGRIHRYSSATYITSGKVAQLVECVSVTGAKQVFVDAELSGIQLRNLQRETGVAVADRTGLILNIFADRARSQAGKWQVELARLNYLSTHLVREWSHLERQRGGLGKTGGPGEKQIELDRRLIAEKIRKLKQQLKTLAKQRDSQRKARSRRGALTVALVGYTNAGKSTLFNMLTGANTLAKDQLFASLDPTARRCYLPGLPVAEQNIIALDTVGFIRDLPHHLVEAFHATLEETRLADLLLIVGDINDPHANDRLNDVREVLLAIGSDSIPQLLVWNKIDLLPTLPDMSGHSQNASVMVSAKMGINIPSLRSKMTDMLGAISSKEMTQ